MTPIEHLTDLLKKTRKPVFVKVLARNDHIWADSPSGGKGQRKAERFLCPCGDPGEWLFPEQLQRKDKDHIFDTEVHTFWPQENAPKIEPSNFVHYSNKGSETHFTGLPKEVFAGLGPSSLLVVAQPEDASGENAVWTGIVVPQVLPITMMRSTCSACLQASFAVSWSHLANIRTTSWQRRS